MDITPTLPKYQTRNPRWHPKFNSYKCNISFIKMQKTQSLTRPTTHAAISTSHNSVSSQYSQPFTSLAAPKANAIFHAANKNLFIKTPFDYHHLTSSSSFYILFLTNLARALQHSARKQHNINTHTLQPILANNKLSLASNKPTSPAKTILQKLRLKTDVLLVAPRKWYI